MEGNSVYFDSPWTCLPEWRKMGDEILIIRTLKSRFSITGNMLAKINLSMIILIANGLTWIV